MSMDVGGYPAMPLPVGASPLDFSGSTELGIYYTGSEQKHAFGRPAIDSYDGSIYRYAKAGAAITNCQLAVHVTATEAVEGIETLAAGAEIGDTVIKFNKAGVTLNQLAGGYVIIFPAANTSVQVRGIVANTISNSSGVVTVTLNAPLDTALTTSDNYEIYASPYASVSQANTSGTLAFLGVPNVSAANAGFLWIKRRGPIFLAPQSTVGDAYVKAGYFRHDGSIDARGNVGSSVTDQRAGYCLVGSYSGDGPLFWLDLE